MNWDGQNINVSKNLYFVIKFNTELNFFSLDKQSENDCQKHYNWSK
jgi:hypothetical protein